MREDSSCLRTQYFLVFPCDVVFYDFVVIIIENWNVLFCKRRNKKNNEI